MNRMRGVVLLLVAASALVACGGTPPPSEAGSSLARTSPSPTPQPPTPAPNDISLADVSWYEVSTNVMARGGNSTRVLIVGVGARMVGELSLGSQTASQRADGRDVYEWSAPQVDGIFDGTALVWGRGGDAARIEAVELASSTVRGLLMAPGAVQVATADSSLNHIFFVTVDDASKLAAGLWIGDLTSGDPPRRLPYTFGTTPISNRFKYRLAANADGSRIAIQPGRGEITIIDTSSSASSTVDPGQPMIGFAGNDLITYGPRFDVVRFDGDSLNGTVVAESVTAAQIAPAGRLLAVMYGDADEPRHYRIEVIDVRTGQRSQLYEHGPETIGPGLTRKDRTFVAFDVPDDWAWLADTILPWIVDAEGQGTKPQDVSQYPIMLNLRSGDVVRLGPFRATTGTD